MAASSKKRPRTKSDAGTVHSEAGHGVHASDFIAVGKAAGLPPIHPLPDGLDVLGLINMLATALDAHDTKHRMLSSDIVEWDQENASLAQRVARLHGAKGNDKSDNEADARLDEQRCDEALAELLHRDPRYLATTFAQAKVLLWRLRVAYGNKHVSVEVGPEDDGKRVPGKGHNVAARRAQTLLTKVAKGIAQLGGPRRRAYFDLLELRRLHRRNGLAFRKALPLLSDGSTDDAIIAVAKLSRHHLELLRGRTKSGADALPDLSESEQVIGMTAADYGVSRDLIAKRLQEAKKLASRKRSKDRRGI